MSFAAIVCSLHARTGKTLLARVLADYFLLSDQTPLVFDTDAIEHALVFAKDPLLSTADFPAILQTARDAHGSLGELRSIEDVELEAIKATLEQTHYKIGRAAAALGISRKTLLEKRKKYGLL